ncbi:MAG: phosphomannomutase, partial [Streblomastix strix]
PTGIFAHSPEPITQNLKDLCQLVKEKHSDIGIAVDPDADRLVLINELGQPLGEEYTLALCTDFILKSGKRGPVVKNLSSSRAIDEIASRYSCECHSSAVGEANVAQLMEELIKQGYPPSIGGEGNGGVMLPDVHIGRDSLVGLALVLQHLADYKIENDGKGTISQLKGTLPVYEIVKDKIALSETFTPQKVDSILNVIKKEWETKAKVNNIDGIRIDSTNDDIGAWWVHLRKSNTEPIVRIIAEARTEQLAKERVAFFFKYFA